MAKKDNLVDVLKKAQAAPPMPRLYKRLMTTKLRSTRDVVTQLPVQMELKRFRDFTLGDAPTHGDFGVLVGTIQIQAHMDVPNANKDENDSYLSLYLDEVARFPRVRDSGTRDAPSDTASWHQGYPALTNLLAAYRAVP